MLRISIISLCLAGGFALKASEIKHAGALTDRILIVHFDDGSVTYPNSLNVSRLDVAKAMLSASWTITGEGDIHYSQPINPTKTGRKSKGTEFIKDPPWGGSSFNPTGKPWASEHIIYLVLDIPLKEGETYVLHSGDLASNGSEWNISVNSANNRSEAVHVNTLGYAPDAPKYGYVYHWLGDLGGLDLTPYAGTEFRVYREGSTEPVKTGIMRKRKSADNPETGQDKDTPGKNFLGAEVYECDFSDLSEEGTYILSVTGIGSSWPFRIGQDPVLDAYYNVMRGLYHQRSGIRLSPPYTQADYIRPVNQNTLVTSDDGTSFAGKLLYSDYPYTSWENSDNGGSSQAAIRLASEGKPLDVAGWYHDAGDWDQYATHERIPVILMLLYEIAPERFCDGDLNLPESGNGIPDIIDEASWLIKFNYRLRKELTARGYSDGGVGGARICADVYTDLDGNAESSKPSWKENRRTIVTQADAFMTYFYAGQAAQFAMILKSLGKDPGAFPVEMLDHADFASMSYDTVNWLSEAEEAFTWASLPENQPAGHNNFSHDVKIYRMYAAVNLFRITGKESYHDAAKDILEELKSSFGLNEDERWGVYSYLLSGNATRDKILQSNLMTVALSTADNQVVNAVSKRACRWGGNWNMPMLVGQATTPWVLEAIFAYELTGIRKYKDAVHTTADYFLGCNPLNTTWITGTGPVPATCGFHLDSRYNHNWVVYPGFIPYGPWSMNYDYNPFTYIIDGVETEGGHGPWNKDWANFSQYPVMNNWPGHERWNGNIHAPLSSENTIHQNTVYGGITYGWVNSRKNTNAESVKKIGELSLGNGDITLSLPGADTLLTVLTDIKDAGFGALKWYSSDDRIAHADPYGRITGITAGSCIVYVSTLDGSVKDSCTVSCLWEEVNVEDIYLDPDSLFLTEGQKKSVLLTILPENAGNRFVDWSYSSPSVAEIDEEGHVTALSPGETWAIARSLNNPDRKDSVFIIVKAASDHTMADFDVLIPVTTDPQPDLPQLYTPGGSNDVEHDNPLPGLPNPSKKVVKWNRPQGDWVLIGMVLPTEVPQDLSQYVQFRFKYFGKGVKDFYIQLIMSDGSQTEINETVKGEDCWQLFSADISVNKDLTQFNIFVNKTGNPGALEVFFDDFMLGGKPVFPFEFTEISDKRLNLDTGQSAVLVAETGGEPFTWITTDPNVATVDTSGKVYAVSGGRAWIRAVPLYGRPVECEIIVDHGIYQKTGSFIIPPSLYPNPFKENLHITLPGTKGTLCVFNLQGQCIYSQSISDQAEIIIPGSGIPSGICIIKFTGETGEQYIHKVVRQ